MILVYVQGLRGPRPERWPALLLDMNGKPCPHLSRHDLTSEEDALSLNDLMLRYPAPVMGAP